MNKLRKIQLAQDEAEVRQCWPVFHELRPHIESEDQFAERWRRQTAEGYQVAYVKQEETVVAAAGYRYLNTMAWGHILYVDDLVATQTSHGIALGTLLCSICKTWRAIEVAMVCTWIQVISAIVRIAHICATAFSYIVTKWPGRLCVIDPIIAMQTKAVPH